jgi:SH3-like domain-containing protein
MPRVKLTRDLVLAIRDRHADGESPRHLAEEFGVSAHTICDIASRQTWAHVRYRPGRRSATVAHATDHRRDDSIQMNERPSATNRLVVRLVMVSIALTLSASVYILIWGH